MLVYFTKMHGLGNDFVVIDAVTQKIKLQAAHIRRIANRTLGIGCDQILLVEPPTNPESDFSCRMYNGNGKEVEQCGNGLRCIGRFVMDNNLIFANELAIDTMAGIMKLELLDDGLVKVNMGQPQLVNNGQAQQLSCESREFIIHEVSIGNPHGVLFVDKIDDKEVSYWGKRLSKHPHFANGANISFIRPVSRNKILIKVYERGAGTTNACGTAACASMVIARKLDHVDSNAELTFANGHLQIQWANESESIWMTGPTCSVFTGRFRL